MFKYKVKAIGYCNYMVIGYIGSSHLISIKLITIIHRLAVFALCCIHQLTDILLFVSCVYCL